MEKLRYGMIGGGPDAFIGAVHRKAAALDGLCELVAGAFSADPHKSAQQGRALGLDPERVYGSYQEMAEREAARSPEERLDFVTIVTPNHLHFPVAKTFIEQGFHIVCDKPLTTTLADAEALVDLVKKHQTLFALTHNYTGYPMVKEARMLVRRGALGTIRKIVVEYAQGWLAELIEASGQKQAAWRTDPAQTGVSSALGDIGTHAENLVQYITGLDITALYADVASVVPGRTLEDDATVLLRYTNGARGVLMASQIAIGEENNLRVRIYGTKASLDWQQERPNILTLRYPDQPETVYKRGNPYLSDLAQHNTRVPPGHPEAFIEAFANIYRNAAHAIQARKAGRTPTAFELDFPTVADGLRGVRFIHWAIESAQAGAWRERE